MAVSALDATVGGASANTYTTLAEANQYHEDRPASGATWSGAEDDEKNAALLWAQKLLDSMFEWSGAVTGYTQALLWPRIGMYYRSGEEVSSSVIPDELKWAQAEFARQLMAADRAGDSDVETQGITKLVAGPVELEFKDNVAAKVVPDAVVNLIPDDWGWVSGSRPSFRRVLRW